MAGVRGASPRNIAQDIAPDEPIPQVDLPDMPPDMAIDPGSYDNPEDYLPAVEASPQSTQLDDAALLAMIQPDASQTASTAVLSDDQLLSMISPTSARDTNTHVQLEGQTPPPQAPPTFLNELGARAQESFASTDTQRQQILAKTYGPENVRKVNDEWQVKKDGKWKDFNPGFWSTVGDIIGAFNPIGAASVTGGSGEQSAKDAIYGMAGAGKSAVSELAALPFELTGAAESATGVGAPAGAATVAVGRLAGGMAGEGVSQLVAPMIGVPPDPNHGLGAQSVQIALTGSLRAAFGAGADKIARITGNWAAGRLTEKMSKAAAQRAAYLGEGTGKAPEQIVQGTVGALKETLDDVNHLVERGILTAVPGGEGAVVLPGQANAMVPEFTNSLAEAAQTNEGRNFLFKQGEMFAKAWQSVAKAADEVSTITLTGLAKNASPSVTETLDAATKFWGATVGVNRKEAVANAGDQIFNVNRVKETINKTALDMGFKPIDSNSGVADFSRRVRPTAETVMDKIHITNREEAEALINRMVAINDKLFSTQGRMTVREIDELYNQLAKKTQNVFSTETSYSHRQVYADLRNAVRDDFQDIMGAPGVLGPAAAERHMVARARYTQFKDAAEELSTLFNHQHLSAKAMSDYLFKNNKDSLDRIAILKPILEQENPGAWQSVVEDWMTTLTQRHSAKADPNSPLYGELNWNGLYREFNTKPEIMKMVFGDQGAKDMLALVRTGMKVQKSTGFTGQVEAQVAKAMGDAAMTIAKHPRAAASLVSRFGSSKRAEEAMVENLTRGGRERLLNRVAQPKRAVIARFLDGLSTGTHTLAVPTTQILSREGARDLSRKAVQ